jgi:hypothetical protein
MSKKIKFTNAELKEFEDDPASLDAQHPNIRKQIEAAIKEKNLKKRKLTKIDLQLYEKYPSMLDNETPEERTRIEKALLSAKIKSEKPGKVELRRFRKRPDLLATLSAEKRAIIEKALIDEENKPIKITNAQLQKFKKDPGLLRNESPEVIAVIKNMLEYERDKPQLIKSVKQIISGADPLVFTNVVKQPKEQYRPNDSYIVKVLDYPMKKPISRANMNALGAGYCCNKCEKNNSLKYIAGKMNMKFVANKKAEFVKPKCWTKFKNRLHEKEQFKDLNDKSLTKLAKMLYRDGVYLDNLDDTF